MKSSKKENNVTEGIMKRIEAIYNMSKIQEEINKRMFGETEAILPAEVKQFGNSGHIPVPRKYLGKKVKVIILKDKEEDKTKTK